MSNGLDLIPIICDYAGIIHPETNFEGMSVRPFAEDQRVLDWRKVLRIESEFGRAIVMENFEGKNQEQLYDFKADPGETRNTIYDMDKSHILEAFRTEFDKMFGKI